MILNETLCIWEMVVFQNPMCVLHLNGVSQLSTEFSFQVTGRYQIEHHNFIALHTKLLPHTEILWYQTSTQCNSYHRMVCFSEND